MITVELEHFSLDKICDSGQCFRMKNLGDGHFSMVAGDQYLEMHQDGGVVDFYCKGRRRDPDLKTGSLGNDRHVSDFPAE